MSYDYESPAPRQEAPETTPEITPTVTNETTSQDTVGNQAAATNLPTSNTGVDTPLLDSVEPTATTTTTSGTPIVQPVTTELNTALSTDPGEDLDPLAVSQAITDLYALPPEQRAQFATELPALFDQMTPDQRALVGSIMMQQGRTYEQGFEGGDITADPTFQAMADVQRAWGEYTAFQGYDPLGRTIDVSVSTTTEDYRTYAGDIEDYRQTQAAQGNNVWSDMFMPYTMWTEAGNIARYTDTANVTWVGENGLRIYGWDRGTGEFNGVNVTQQERDAADSVEQRGDGAITGADGETYVQTHMGLDKVVEQVNLIGRDGYVDDTGEFQATPDQAPTEDQPEQLPLFDLEPYEVAEVEAASPVAGHMPVPDPNAPATDPANMPYLELSLHRAGFDDQLHIDVGSQTIRVGQTSISMRQFSAVLGLDGMDLTAASTWITTQGAEVLATANQANLNLDPRGVVNFTASRETTRGDTTSGVQGGVQVDLTNGLGVQGSLDYTRGDNSVGVNATVQFDENGELSGYGGGVQGTYQFDKLKLGGGISVQDTQRDEILTAEDASGADAAVVQNLGGGPVLVVGEEHHLQVDVSAGVTNGPFGANVGVGSDSGTAVHFYQTVDPNQLPTDPAAIEELAQTAGWPALEQVYGVDDIDMLAMEPGTAYRFDDFSAAHANAGVSVYGVGVSLGIEGQEYESVMIARPNDETVRISVMSTDAQGWNAGLNFQGVGLFDSANQSGNTTLVELDVDITTQEGRDALEVFRTTGALPGSYDQEFMQSAMQLTAMEQQLATLDPLDPQYDQIREQYATLSGELHGQATSSNAEFVGDPELMEQPDIAPGVTYAHRNDQDFQSHRQTLLGFLQWGSTETLGQDRIFKDGELDVTLSMDRQETGLLDWILHGVYGQETAGSVVNPHHDTFSFGVFASRTMNDEDRALLSTLPQSEDPMTQAWIDGEIEMDAVGQVGVFLTDDHVARMQDGFEAMRAAGIDPTAAVQAAMVDPNGLDARNTDILIQDGLVDAETVSAMIEQGMDPTTLFSTPTSEFATLSPEAQQVYVAQYVETAQQLGANPWTAMDMVSQLPPGPERDAMMNDIAVQIERMDPDHASGPFEMIRLINEMGQVDPTVQQDLQTAVVVSVTDREVADYLALPPDQRQAAMLQDPWDPSQPGVWQYVTGDVMGQFAEAQANGWQQEAWMVEGNAAMITDMVVAADRAGELDLLMGNLGAEGGTTALLDSMALAPGNQELILRSLLDSPVYGAEALAWAQANGVDTTGWQ